VHDVARVVDVDGTEIGVVSKDGRVLDQNENQIGNVDIDGNLVDIDSKLEGQPYKVKYEVDRPRTLPEYRQIEFHSRDFYNKVLRAIYNLLRFFIVVVWFYFMPVLIIFLQFYLLAIGMKDPDQGESSADLFTFIND